MYKFNESKIEIKKGAKNKDDYIILLNNIQIKDKVLFEKILLNVSDEQEAKNFITKFAKFKHIKFIKDRIETKSLNSQISDVYQYSLDVEIKDELKPFLFISILRCDIDNICYPPPFNNGCVRIFVQILLIFSCKFEWGFYKDEKKHQNDIVNFVYDSGFSLSREEFKNIYSRYFEEYNE